MTNKQDEIRIVQIANTISVADGGPARNAVELNHALNSLDGSSAELFWLRGSEADSILQADSESGVLDLKVRRLTWLGRSSAGRASWYSVFNALRAADVVILHGYYLAWTPLFALIAKITGCEVFLTPHGSLTARQQKYSATKKRFFDLTAGIPLRASLSAFVTGSEVERDELLAKFPSSTVLVGGVGVQIPSVYKSVGALHDPLRLLSMSRVAEKKRIDISIDTIRVLETMGIDAILIVAGTGHSELVERLRSHSRQQGLEDRVKFVGQLSGDAKHRAFLEADVFLLPSEDENFGIGFAEAMAHGLPGVVSTNVASALDMPTGAGELVTAPTPALMAQAVLAIVESERYRGSPEIARRFAESEFSWTAVAEQWIDIMACHSTSDS